MNTLLQRQNLAVTIPFITNQKTTYQCFSCPLKIQICYFSYDQIISFKSLHAIVKYPTPDQLTKYNHAILLYKIFNNPNESKDWLDLLFHQNFKERNIKANFFDTNRYKPGKTLLSKRFITINSRIPYDWLNLPLSKFKTKCKL